MKFCLNCKHVTNEDMHGGMFVQCTNKKILNKTDLITGKKTAITIYCELQREDNFIICRLFETCGKEGRFFEAKHDKE